MENVIKSIDYLDTINKIDNLVFKLLYDNQEGYTLLKSKEAILNKQKYLDKFEIEADKTVKNSQFSDFDELISQKKKYLLEKIEIHCNKETINYANEVYNSIVDNLLLFVSTNKENKEFLDDIKNKLFNCANWLGDICFYNNNERKALISKLNEQFINALKSNDNDYINQDVQVKSDYLLYLELRNLILNNEAQFLEIDLNSYKFKLSLDDINYFNQCKLKLNTNNKTNLKDELLLVNSALEILKLNNNEMKYDFIHQVQNDFAQQKPSSDDEKIKIVKRRMKLFNSKEESEYYKKQLNSSF